MLSKGLCAANFADGNIAATMTVCCFWGMSTESDIKGYDLSAFCASLINQAILYLLYYLKMNEKTAIKSGLIGCSIFNI